MEATNTEAVQSRFDGKTKWAILLVAILLSVLTYFITQFVDRFGIVQDQLLKNDTFLNEGASWQRKGSQLLEFQNNKVKISNQAGKSQTVFQNVEVNTPAFYRFSYTAEVNDVVPGSPEDWALASISIIYRDAGGERIGSKMVTALSGTHPSSQFTHDMLLEESVASIDFAVRLYRAGGEFIVSDPVVSSLEEVTVYKALRLSIVAVWAILFAFVIYVFIKVLNVWQLSLVVAMAGVALVGTMMPESAMTGLTQKMAGLLPESFLAQLRTLLSGLYGDNKFAEAGTEVSKLGHFLIFTCFGLFAGLLWRSCGVYYAIAAIFVFAVVTEALQTLVYGRTTNISDLILDGAGGMLGLVIGIGLAQFFGLFRKAVNSEVEENYYEEDHFDESNRY